jgi:hypothetical protein
MTSLKDTTTVRSAALSHADDQSVDYLVSNFLMPITLFLYYGCLTICLLITLLSWTGLGDHFRYLAWLIVVTWLVESIGLYLMNQDQNSNALFHVYQPVEYALLCGYYRPLFPPAIRRLITGSAVGFGIFCVANVIWLQPLQTPNSNAFMLEAVLLVGWSVYYLYLLLQQDELPSLWVIPEFWISTGLLFFYGGAFFLMGLLNYLMTTNVALASRLYIINHLLNIILYGLYSVGILLCRTTRQTSASSS